LSTGQIPRCSYLYTLEYYDEKEKISMIEELLNYEGDTSLCSSRITCYNPKRSQTVPEGIEYYSIQLEALFIINHIILKDPYSFSPYPMLRNFGGYKIETIKGELIQAAYKSYKDWLKYVKKEGLSKTLQNNILPLNEHSSVYWY
jgi:hypothetical protein